VNKVVETEAPRVVAIGASAGGLDAFRKLIENLPVDTDMAFVLLTHILRGSNSLLQAYFPELTAHARQRASIELPKNEVFLLSASTPSAFCASAINLSRATSRKSGTSSVL
jgi:two-component system CheB/CheR fusion protein